jgi:hypothetical protein
MIAVLLAAGALLADTTPAASQAAATQAATPAAAAAAQAQTAAPAGPAVAAKPADKKADKSDKGQLVCHTEVVTGSMFPTKTCYRKDEAADRRREEQLKLYQSQQSGLRSQ